MKKVSWSIHVEADSAREAAEKAMAIQRNPGSLVPVFDVQGRDGKTVRVDLTTGAMDEQRVRCPRCGQTRLAQVDTVEGLALIEAVRLDGTVVWAGETRMDWDSQRPAHFPPQIVCLACDHRMTFSEMIQAAHLPANRKEERKEQKAS
jgi:hypothetical protein